MPSLFRKRGAAENGGYRIYGRRDRYTGRFGEGSFAAEVIYCSGVFYHKEHEVIFHKEREENTNLFYVTRADLCAKKSMIYTDIPFNLNDLSNKIIRLAIKVHRALGPGLLESAYKECLF